MSPEKTSGVFSRTMDRDKAEVTLPSGRKLVVLETTGREERLLSRLEKNKNLDAINEFLASCTENLDGKAGHPAPKDFKKMLTGDRTAILLHVRKLTHGATIDEETAASCFYKLPRKKKDETTGQWVQGYIEGPGVRLAEIVGSCWRNLRYAARVIREENGCVVAQGMAHDLERNVAMTLEVKRRITYSDGRRYNEDLITLASNAACAIALRNVIFKVVPKAFIDVIYHAAKKKAIGDATTLTERRNRAIEYFSKMGVSEKRILNTIGRNSITEIGLEELEILTGVRTAIREGDAKVDDIFPETDGPQSEENKPGMNRTQALAERIKNLRSQKSQQDVA